MPVYFYVPSIFTIRDVGAKSVVIKASGSEKMWMTVMLIRVHHIMKLPPCVMLNQNNYV
jgi:hypothetical protein